MPAVCGAAGGWTEDPVDGGALDVRQFGPCGQLLVSQRSDDVDGDVEVGGQFLSVRLGRARREASGGRRGHGAVAACLDRGRPAHVVVGVAQQTAPGLVGEQVPLAW